jgi:hypothetical protein
MHSWRPLIYLEHLDLMDKMKIRINWIIAILEGHRHQEISTSTWIFHRIWAMFTKREFSMVKVNQRSNRLEVINFLQMSLNLFILYMSMVVQSSTPAMSHTKMVNQSRLRPTVVSARWLDQKSVDWTQQSARNRKLERRNDITIIILFNNILSIKKKKKKKKK